MKNRVMKIPTESIYEDSDRYMDKMCGFYRKNKVSNKVKKRAYEIRRTIFTPTEVEFLVSELEQANLRENQIFIGNDWLTCKALEEIAETEIEGVYCFLLHSPMPDLSELSSGDAQIADVWQTAFADAARDYLQEFLQGKAREKFLKEVYITDAIGPGFYGIEPTATKAFFEELDAGKIEMSLTDSGLMEPLKSIAGFFLVLNKESALPSANCVDCIGNKRGCIFCKNFKV